MPSVGASLLLGATLLGPTAVAAHRSPSHQTAALAPAAASTAAWTAMNPPSPSHEMDVNASITATACAPGTSWCAALGTYTTAKLAVGLMALIKNHNGWRSSRVSLPAQASAHSWVNLRAMACPAVDTCFAVGSYRDDTGVDRSLMVYDVMGVWSTKNGAIRAAVHGALWDAIDSISCPSTTACSATGHWSYATDIDSRSVVLSYAGGRWTVRRVPMPAGTARPGRVVGILGSISCSSAGNCVAVGNLSIVGPVLIVERNGVWSAVRAPSPFGSQAEWLAAVSCPANAGCVAVGTYGSPGDPLDQHGLILSQAKTTWTAREAPPPPGVPSGTWTYFTSISCPSANRCVAAGVYGPGPPPVGGKAQRGTAQDYHPFVITRSGKAWTSANVGPSTNALPEIQLTCPISGSCLALNVWGPEQLSRSASRWPDTGPLPPDMSGQVAFNSLACSSVECFAAGNYPYSSGGDKPLVVASRGKGWKLESASPPSDGRFHLQVALDAVTCDASGTCLATGKISQANQYFLGNPVIETRHGGTWTAQELFLNGYPGAHINTMSCPSAGLCTGGGYWFGRDGSRPLIFNQTSSGWSVARAPEPSDESWTHWAVIKAISCTSATSCAAVGQYQTHDTFLGLALTETAGKWTATRAPLPADSRPYDQDVSIDQVSCPAAGSCVAFGGYTNKEEHREGVILTLAHGRWTAAEAPLSRKYSYPYGVKLTGLACAGPGDCVVVGHYDSGQSSHPLVHALLIAQSGKRWTSTDVRPPSGLPTAAGLAPSAVSCPSADRCYAVGTSQNGNYSGLVWFEGSAGRWTDDVLPVPVGADPRIPLTVSALACGSGSSCSAVGSFESATPADTGLTQGLVLTYRDGVWSAQTTAPPASGISDSGLSAVAADRSTGYVAVGDYSTNDLPAPEGIIAQGG